MAAARAEDFQKQEFLLAADKETVVGSAGPAVLPTTFVNNTGVTPAYFTIIGQNPNDLTDSRWHRVTATGQLVPVMASDGVKDPNSPALANCDYNIPFPTTGAPPFPLPLVRAGRIYVSLGNKLVTQVTIAGNNWVTQDGWSNPADPNYNYAWDWVEINYVQSVDSGLPGMGVNTTAVQMLSLPMTLTLTSNSGTATQTSGFKANARQLIMQGLTGDPHFSSLVIQGTNSNVAPLRAISADNGVRNLINKTPNVPTFDPSLYSSYIDAVWRKYTTATLTVMTSAFGTYAGKVNAANQLVFRQTDSTRPNQKPITVNHPAPTDVIIGNGALIGDCPGPPPNPITDDYLACGEIGSILSAAFNRSTLLVQDTLLRNPPCPLPYLGQFYQNPPVNVYASLIHAHALPNPPFAPLGGTYAFGFDDNCNQSSLISDLQNPSAMSITVDPF